MKNTKNLKLLKPDQTDVYDIDHMNQNADILDKEITGIKGILGVNGEVIEDVKKSIKHITDVELNIINWKREGEYYVYTYKHFAITRNTSVAVHFHLESLSNARYVLLTRVDKAGEVKIFARSKPTATLVADLLLMTEVF